MNAMNCVECLLLGCTVLLVSYVCLILDTSDLAAESVVVSSLFACYMTRSDTAMSLRQAKQKSWKTLGKGELPEKPTI